MQVATKGRPTHLHDARIFFHLFAFANGTGAAAEAAAGRASSFWLFLRALVRAFVHVERWVHDYFV